MALKNLVLILGATLVLVGLAGFAWSDLLGMHLTPTHNAVHILSGGLALYFGSAGTLAGARGFLLAFGLAYALLGVVGFVAPGIVATVLGHDGGATAEALMPDNVVHFVLGAAGLITAFVFQPSRELPLAGLSRLAR